MRGAGALTIDSGPLRGVKPLFLFLLPLKQYENRVHIINQFERGIKGVSKANELYIKSLRVGVI
jgi:hypothetical protein